MFVHWCEPQRGGHTTDIDLSMFELAALHAAARTRRVIVRDGAFCQHYIRTADEPAATFLSRIVEARDGVAGPPPGAGEPSSPRCIAAISSSTPIALATH